MFLHFLSMINWLKFSGKPPKTFEPIWIWRFFRPGNSGHLDIIWLTLSFQCLRQIVSVWMPRLRISPQNNALSTLLTSAVISFNVLPDCCLFRTISRPLVVNSWRFGFTKLSDSGFLNYLSAWKTNQFVSSYIPLCFFKKHEKMSEINIRLIGWFDFGDNLDL